MMNGYFSYATLNSAPYRSTNGYLWPGFSVKLELVPVIDDLPRGTVNIIAASGLNIKAQIKEAGNQVSGRAVFRTEATEASCSETKEAETKRQKKAATTQPALPVVVTAEQITSEISAGLKIRPNYVFSCVTSRFVGIRDTRGPLLAFIFYNTLPLSK